MSDRLGGCVVADLLLPTGRGVFVQGTPVRYTDSGARGHNTGFGGSGGGATIQDCANSREYDWDRAQSKVEAVKKSMEVFPVWGFWGFGLRAGGNGYIHCSRWDSQILKRGIKSSSCMFVIASDERI